MEKQSAIEREDFDFNVLEKISGISRGIKFYILLAVFNAIVGGGLSNALADDKKPEPSSSSGLIPIGKLRFPDPCDASGILRNSLKTKKWEMMNLYISGAINDGKIDEDELSMFKEFKKDLQLDFDKNKNNLADLLNIYNSIGNYSDFFKDEIERNKKYIQMAAVNEFNKLNFDTLYMAFSKPCIGALTKEQREFIVPLLLKNLSAELKKIDIKNEEQHILLAKNLFVLMEVTFNAAIFDIKFNISDISEIIQNTIIPNLSKIKNGKVLVNLYMLVPYDKDVLEKLEGGDEREIQKQISELRSARDAYWKAFMLD